MAAVGAGLVLPKSVRFAATDFVLGGQTGGLVPKKPFGIHRGLPASSRSQEVRGAYLLVFVARARVLQSDRNGRTTHAEHLKSFEPISYATPVHRTRAVQACLGQIYANKYQTPCIIQRCSCIKYNRPYRILLYRRCIRRYTTYTADTRCDGCSASYTAYYVVYLEVQYTASIQYTLLALQPIYSIQRYTPPLWCCATTGTSRHLCHFASLARSLAHVRQSTDHSVAFCFHSEQ